MDWTCSQEMTTAGTSATTSCSEAIAVVKLAERDGRLALIRTWLAERESESNVQSNAQWD